MSIAVVALLPWGVPAAADTHAGAQGSIRLLDKGLRATSPNGLELWVSGRRAFQQIGGNRVGSFDLDTLEPVAESGDLGRLLMAGQSFFAVDEERGWLFVPYRQPLVAVGNLDPACPALANSTCVTGVHVLDGSTLEVVRTIPLLTASTGGAILRPALVALHYAPPRATTDSGKLYLLLRDDAIHSVTQTESNTPQRTRNLMWLVQADPAKGLIDWMARAEACTSVPPGTDWMSNATDFSASRAHPYDLFRVPDPDRPYLYVGCYGQGSNSVVARLTLAADGSGIQRQETFLGPSASARIIGDPGGERMLIESMLAGSTTWFVFDGRVSGIVGTVGIGPADSAQAQTLRPRTIAGVDAATGRLYVVDGPRGATYRGGLFLVDARRSNPLPQALQFPEFAAVYGTQNDPPQRVPIAVDPARGDRPRRLFVRNAGQPEFLVFEEDVPVTVDPVVEAEEPLSLDLDEEAGVTSVSFLGEARGYGLRTLVLGGTDGALRVVTPAGTDLAAAKQRVLAGEGSPNQWVTTALDAVRERGLGAEPKGAYRDDCGTRDREFVLGLAGAHDALARIDHGGLARADAQAAYADEHSREDFTAPVTRCSFVASWQELTRRAPMPEPSHEWDNGAARCSEDEGDNAERIGDERFTGMAVEVACAGGKEVRGTSQVRLAAVDVVGAGDLDGPAVTVGSVSSAFRVVREPGKGLVAESEAVVRGLSIRGGSSGADIRIGGIRAVARAWATGRHQQPVQASEGSGCVPARTAGTCYTREFFDVKIKAADGTPILECDGRCPSAEQVAAGLRSVLLGQFAVRLPEPDPVLARGRDDGAQAGIQKRPEDQLAEAVLNADPLSTLAALELVRIADGQSSRSRYILQFAGVQAASTYGISCLLTMVEGSCTDKPGQVRVELADEDGAPLEGGVFELVPAGFPVDPISETGEALPLSSAPSLPDLAALGTCTTDSSGSCTIPDVPAGEYLLVQVAAPALYQPVLDPVPVSVGPGSDIVVELVNLLAVAMVNILLTDDAEEAEPLEGGVFEVYVDVDGDGVLGLDDTQAAACTTDLQGRCSMTGIPVGAVVLHQAAAPEGYEPVDDIAFAFDAPGQTADVTVVNAAAWEEGEQDDESPAPPARDEPAAASGPDDFLDDEEWVEVIIDGGYQASAPVVTDLAVPAVYQPPMVADAGLSPMAAPADTPSLVQRIVQAPREAVRMLLRHPREAVAFGGVLLLFAGAVAGVWRRRLLTGVLAGT